MASSRCWWLSSTSIALTAGIAGLLARPSQACEPLEFGVEVLVPPAGATDIPRDGAFLAVVDAPGDMADQITLTDASGALVPLVVNVELNTSHERGLAWAHPTVALDPQTSYTWALGETAVPFTTGDGFDPAIPNPSGLTVLSELEVLDGDCFPDQPLLEYEVQVNGLAEPVGVYAIAGVEEVAGDFIAGVGDTVTVRLPESVSVCFEVMVEDYGGHRSSAGEICLDGSGVGGSSSSGADETGEPPDTTSGTTGSAPPPSDPDTTTGSPAPGASTSGTPGAVDAADRGCACRATSQTGGTPAGWWLMVLIACRRIRPVFRRRR
ncbi:MAG: hypothetical protein K0V04_02445 [Deltaproteobacteria bacterium]|nr:hypothetical protein [Deltaproteobacteria bacterium]